MSVFICLNNQWKRDTDATVFDANEVEEWTLFRRTEDVFLLFNMKI